jgi:hypothetical protein
MPMMTANRDVVLASLMGHRIVFLKNISTHVPPECMTEALTMGVLPDDSDEVLVLGTVEAKVPVVLDPFSRNRKIDEAIALIAKRNLRNDFTAAGLPKTAAVEKLTGIDDIQQREIAASVQRAANAAAEAKTFEPLTSNQILPSQVATPVIPVSAAVTAALNAE